MSTATRDRIVEAADDLFYRQGFAAASFAAIADRVGISRGNFYHHFKTKDEILTAVIEKRLLDRRELLDHWRALGEDPRSRIQMFIAIMTVNERKILAHGCPIGTLCAELGKLEHGAKHASARLFTLFKDWLQQQFAELGFAPARAETLAMRLLARSQGASTLASAMEDAEFLRSEVEEMARWLDTLTPETDEN